MGPHGILVPVESRIKRNEPRQTTSRIPVTQAPGELLPGRHPVPPLRSDKVKRGLDDAHQQGAFSQEDAENRLSQWLTE